MKEISNGECQNKKGCDRGFQKLRVVEERCMTCGTKAVFEYEWLTIYYTQLLVDKY